jgi:hemerythrin-like domain-containing protein
MEGWREWRQPFSQGIMAIVGSLHEQHGDLKRHAEGIVALFDRKNLAQDGTAIRLQFSAFARKLRVHIALEERYVCERLLRHPERVIVDKAALHQSEMRTLHRRITECANRWSSAVEIQGAAAQLIEETRKVLDLTQARFEKEDRELYPIVERLMSPSGTWPVDLIEDGARIKSAG